MKIGILTLPFNNNYGGYLQAYALMTVLRQMGHDTELIYRREERRKREWVIKTAAKNLIKRILGRKVIKIVPDQEWEHRRRGRLMMPFVDKYIAPKTKPLFSTKEMYCLIKRKKYDAIVIGSDQVWRPDYGQKHVQDFFLTELPASGTIRIAYAASFGTSQALFSPKEREECGIAIQNFKAVSIREKGGLKIFDDYGWRLANAPVVVLDPTLLLARKHYLSLLNNVSSKSKEKIFCYVLDKDEVTNKIVDTVAQVTHAELYHIIDVEKWQDKDYVMPSIEDWLCGIRDSRLVVTDSYHGMAFSIIMQKPFMVKVNQSRGSDRFITLLSKLGLEDRMVYNEESVKDTLDSDIDWSKIEVVLDIERKTSVSFLKNSLQ